MNHKQGIAAVLGFALVATYSASGGAAERPGQAMADVTARLTAASTHAAALEQALSRQAPVPSPPASGTTEAVPGAHDIGAGPDGGGYPAEGPTTVPRRPARKITADMAAALNGLEAAVREAQALAGGHAYLEPGMEHVLANAERIRANGEQSADALALSQEIAIELIAVANNARILEAEADLRAASVALDKEQTNAFRVHVESAVRALGEAQSKGAYHLEDDIATLQVVLARLQGGAPARQAVTADAVDELIGDVNEHLADLGGE